VAVGNEPSIKLIIAKLDSLSRNVVFIATLTNDRIDLACCDFLQANRLALHVVASVAEHECEMTSERTLAGLAATKEQGVQLGSLRRSPSTRRDWRTLQRRRRP